MRIPVLATLSLGAVLCGCGGVKVSPRHKDARRLYQAGAVLEAEKAFAGSVDEVKARSDGVTWTESLAELAWMKAELGLQGEAVRLMREAVDVGRANGLSVAIFMAERARARALVDLFAGEALSFGSPELRDKELALRRALKEGYRKAVLARDPGEERRMAEELHGLLVAPFEASLAPGKTVLVVPHAGLHYLPFAALLSDAGRLGARFPLRYAPSLTVLSACRTAMGAVGSGDEVVGLNRALAYAGVGTVVSSLWSVEDRSTAKLMAAFHEGLRSGGSPAAALREAQASLMKDPASDQPFFWAAFGVYGLDR